MITKVVRRPIERNHAMKRTALGICSLLMVLISAFSAALLAQEGMEGRWLLTERSGDQSYASWLRVTHQPGEDWKALYLHRGGHPLPCDVRVEGSRIEVQIVPESGSTTNPNSRRPKLTGVLENGRLQGTGTDGGGRTFSWKGERAPDRLEGQGRSVTWGEPIQLFNGRDLEGWRTVEQRESKWKVVNGLLVNESTGANLRTTPEFRDFKLHVEFKIPPESNSGIYLRGRYETQVADDFGKEPYIRMVGGIYGQIAPLVNACKPAGEWNVLDATLVGYRVTILLNGQTTVDGQLIDGITGGALSADERAPGPIMLQGDHGQVSYRNIVLTPAK
jgi:hypothetical protein